MARLKAARSRLGADVSKASTIAGLTCQAHLAVRSVEVATSATICTLCARERLTAATTIAAQIKPSTIAGLAVENARRLACDFHSLNSSSVCQRKRYT